MNHCSILFKTLLISYMNNNKKSDLFMKCLYKEQVTKTFIIMVYSLVFYRGMDRKKLKIFES